MKPGRLGLRAKSWLALSLAVLCGSSIILARPERRCITVQQAIFLRSTYRDVPWRAESAAQIYCRLHDDVPAREAGSRGPQEARR